MEFIGLQVSSIHIRTCGQATQTGIQSVAKTQAVVHRLDGRLVVQRTNGPQVHVTRSEHGSGSQQGCHKIFLYHHTES